MSIGGSCKEYLYLVYTKLFPQQLERVLSNKITDIMLEKKHQKRKIDICGYDKTGRRYLIEVQLTKSNDMHLRQVKELIRTSNQVEDTLIVWIATKFRKDDLIKIKHKIEERNCNIEFVALNLNEDIIPILEEINAQDTLKQVELLGKLSEIETHYKMVEGIKNYNSKTRINAKVIDSNKSYTYKQEYLLDILKESRRDCKNFPNIYQYKEVSNNYLTFGSGYQDIDIRITYNRKKLVGVEVIFAQTKSKKVFYNLLIRKSEIDDELDYIVSFWDSKYHKIATYINPLSFRDRENTVKMICRIVKKYIYTFNKYLKEEIDRGKI